MDGGGTAIAFPQKPIVFIGPAGYFLVTNTEQTSTKQVNCATIYLKMIVLYYLIVFYLLNRVSDSKIKMHIYLSKYFIMCHLLKNLTCKYFQMYSICTETCKSLISSMLSTFKWKMKIIILSLTVKC